MAAVRLGALRLLGLAPVGCRRLTRSHDRLGHGLVVTNQLIPNPIDWRTRSRRTGSSKSVPWLGRAVVACLVLASLIAPQSARAEEPLHVSLDYRIQAQPYSNTVPLNITGWQDTGIAVDRDPSSPYYGTIYIIRGYTPQSADFKIRRSLDGGLTFGDPIPLELCSSFSNTTCDVERPGIAVGKDGAAFIVDPNRATGEVAVLRSVDQGLSWLRMASFKDFGGLASIATDDASGTVYVGAVNASGTVLVVRSADGGSTWGPSVAVSSGATRTTPSVAAFQDNVTVVFLTADTGSCGIGSCGHVSVGASSDGGVTWPNVTAVSPPNVSSASAPSVAASPDGIFAVSWNSLVPAAFVEATYLSISHDRGNTFSAPIEVSRYRGMYELEVGGTLVFDSESRLYVAWQSFGNASERGAFTESSIYVGSSGDLGQNFTNASFRVSLQGSGANGSSYEHLAAGADETVYLTWYDVFAGGGALFRSVSGEASGDVAPGAQVVRNARVDVELRDPTTATVEVSAMWTGSTLVFAELPPNVYEVWIRVGNASALAGSIPVRTWRSTAFTVRLDGGAGGPPPFPWMTTVEVGGTVLAATAATLAVLQHTRLTREQVLQRKVRLLIFEAVHQRPGSSFTEIRNAIGLQNGVAAYHLRVLEKQGLVHSEKGRRHRWYYPNGDVSLWRDRPLSPLQKSVLENVAQDPGIAIRELARRLNRHHAAVAYNVRAMATEGLLRTQRMGRKVRCFPLDDGGKNDPMPPRPTLGGD